MDGDLFLLLAEYPVHVAMLVAIIIAMGYVTCAAIIMSRSLHICLTGEFHIKLWCSKGLVGLLIKEYFADSKNALAAITKNALAADKPASIFEGTYSDPNHPGGTRTVTLSPDSPSVGRYRLATVTGGGGTGEPASFTLPAMLQGDNKIVVDFSAKGGPKVSNSSSRRLLFR